MRVLLVTTRYPWPPWTGDRLRTTQCLAALAPHHEVALLCPTPPRPEPTRPPGDQPFRVEHYAAGPVGLALGLGGGLMRGLPAQAALYSAPDLGRRLRELAPQHDLVILQLARLAGHLGALGETPVVVDLVDALSLSSAKRADLDSPLLRPLWHLEARRLARVERQLVDRSHGALVVCQRDAEHLVAAGAPAERLRVVPIAVDVDRATEGPPATPPPTLVMAGNLGYFTTRDGIRWWLEVVWPELRRSRPDVGLVLAGARPGRGLRRLAKRCGVEVVAAPRDLRAVVARASIALAPLRAGAGLPIKVLEAWSVGTPVVASPWAAAGVGAADGEGLLIAEGAAEWIEAIGRLLVDPDAARALSSAARLQLERRFSTEVVATGFLEAVGEPSRSTG